MTKNDVDHFNMNEVTSKMAESLKNFIEANKAELTFARCRTFPSDLNEKSYLAAVDYFEPGSVVVATLDEFEGNLVHD